MHVVNHGFQRKELHDLEFWELTSGVTRKIISPLSAICFFCVCCNIRCCRFHNRKSRDDDHLSLPILWVRAVACICISRCNINDTGT